MLLPLLIVFVVMAWPGLGEESAKPACNTGNQGRLWPEAANVDRQAARRAERCGELQVCTRGVWRYRWEPLTVHVQQLAGRSSLQIPGCGGSGGSEVEVGQQVEGVQSRNVGRPAQVASRE